MPGTKKPTGAHEVFFGVPVGVVWVEMLHSDSLRQHYLHQVPRVSPVSGNLSDPIRAPVVDLPRSLREKGGHVKGIGNAEHRSGPSLHPDVTASA